MRRRIEFSDRLSEPLAWLFLTKAKKSAALLIFTDNQSPFTNCNSGADATAGVVLPDFFTGRK